MRILSGCDLPIHRVVVAMLSLSLAASCNEVGDGIAEGEPECIIGDPFAEAEIGIVLRTTTGLVAGLVDGGEVPLVRHPEGGQVTLIGVRAKNVTCGLSISATFFDECGEPDTAISRDTRSIELEEGADGFGQPMLPETFQNYANISVCPAFQSSIDGEGQPYRLELRVIEARSRGEAGPRRHVLGASVTPVCAEPAIEDDCRCECDAGFVLEIPAAEQCPTIHDDDLPAGECPER